jgi:hypothetical protein
MKRLLCVTALMMFFLFTTNTALAQTSFKVAWKQGIILGLLVPPNTTKAQLKDFIYKIRQGKKDDTLSKFLPPVNLGLTDKYSNFIVLIFSDPKWAATAEYNKYEKTGMQSNVAKTYLNHVVASYWYDFDGKEYGSLGHDDGVVKSNNYKKLF